MRLRKEYLYMKGLEGKEKEMYDRKQKIKTAMAGEDAAAKHRLGPERGAGAVTVTLVPAASD